MATFWLDRHVWGLSPALFHLTNLVLIATSAALVVAVARRYTGDARLAALAGLLFALHPYHVENAAWIAVRGDPIYSVLLLLAAWSYDRWREGGVPRLLTRDAPVVAILLFEGALLAKETAIVLLPFLVLIGVLDRTRRPSRREWMRGLLPLVLVGLAHFLILRSLALSGRPGRTLTPGMGAGWARHAFGFAVAAIVPVDGEILASQPLLYGSAAAAALLILIVLARRSLHAARRITGRTDGSATERGSNRSALLRTALGSAAVFGVLLLPSIVGFQERYLFLPAAASCLLLASLTLCLRARAAALVLSVVMVGWGLGCAHHWLHWRQAAIASRRLVADLVAASQRPEVEEIVVANMPFRVRGGSVAGDFEAALRVTGAKPVRVRAVSYVSYPWADAPATDSMEAPGAQATDRETVSPRASVAITSTAAEVVLRIPDGPFSHYVGPSPPPGGRRVETSHGTIVFDSGTSGIIRIRTPISPGERREVYAWLAGRLERLSLSP